MERRLPLLTGGPRDRPPASGRCATRSPGATTCSTPDEQALFRRLAVFAGGFTLEAAEAVGGGGESGQGGERILVLRPPLPDPRPSVLDGSPRWSTRACCGRTTLPDGTARYRMLETIREFGLRAAGGERRGGSRPEPARRLVPGARRGFGGGFAYVAEDHVQRPAEAEQDNLRAALAWLESAGDASGMLRLAVAIQPLWMARGQHAEAIGWFERGLAAGRTYRPRSGFAARRG